MFVTSFRIWQFADIHFIKKNPKAVNINLKDVKHGVNTSLKVDLFAAYEYA